MAMNSALMKSLFTGSESRVFLDENRIIKYRVPKKYRLVEIDEQIRAKRTQKEIKIIRKLKEGVVNVPEVIEMDEKSVEKIVNYFKKESNSEFYESESVFKDTRQASVVMSHIEGKSLHEMFRDGNCTVEMLKKFGKMIFRVHSLGIIHGDVTPSNIMVKDRELFLIDFGLSFYSVRWEDRAVDVWMLEKILRSLFSDSVLLKTEAENNHKNHFDYFLEGYLEVIGKEKETFMAKLLEVRERGRKIGC